MLARLDRTRGVETSWTNWSGTAIALDLAPGASRGEVFAAVTSALAPDFEPSEVSAAEAAEALDSGKWFRKDETFALSEYEAKVLAKKGVKRARALFPLEARNEERLERRLEDGWRRLFREYHEGRAVLSRKSELAFWKAELPRIIADFPEASAVDLRAVFAE